MVAGEASGDLLAGLLLGGLHRRWPAATACGIGGPRMAAQGFEAWSRHDELSFHGISFELLRRYRGIVAMRRRLAKRLEEARPDAFIGIDAPDFNLGLEARLKRSGVKTVHFVSPSIWAWRGGRVAAIGEATDLLLCLFPFEPAIYAKHGIAATYVGHPLADAIPLEVPRLAARHALAIGTAATVVALMPGSRRSEVQHLAPRLLGAAAVLQRRRPALRFVLPVVEGMWAQIEPMVHTARADGVNLTLFDGRSHEVLAACDAVLLASGTATLEAALFKRPMVVAYAMPAFNWQFMKRLRYQPWVSLPNVLAQDFVVPELLQGDAKPEALADAAMAWLDDPERCAALHRRFDALHRQLRCNTAEAATDAIAQVIAG
jgi:lipid-A-disaccharide synthase